MNNRVRAVIVDGGKIALIERVREGEVYYIFPGGGVEEGESFTDALKREVKEELGIAVVVGEPFAEHRYAIEDGEVVHHFYICTWNGGQFGTGDGPEYQPDSPYLKEGTHDPVWVDLTKLPEIDLKPAEVKNLVIERFA